MGSITTRPETKRLFFDFRYQGRRCREQTTLSNTQANRSRLNKILAKIEAEITLGTFDYQRYFPNSKNVKLFSALAESESQPSDSNSLLFKEFVEEWFLEKKVEWRETHITTVRQIIDKYIVPSFGTMPLKEISRRDIYNFRAKLSKKKGRTAATLSPSRINHIMNPLRMLLQEAANRYDFITPYQGIKALKIPKTDVEPFTIEEVQNIIHTVRDDYKHYFTVRFFSGVRSSEIHGLQWNHVDFSNRLIMIRQAWVNSEIVPVKNDGSFREIDMSTPVYDALKEQFRASGHQKYVFPTSNDTPLDNGNVTKRVWYPLLRHLGLTKRRPYQTRHTTATLWLASGESPEWIARQMGHSTTTMLFRVYSRFVPNLTRSDGSAFEYLLKQKLVEEKI